MLDEMLTVDWEQVRFKRAISGFLAILIALAFATTVDEVVLSATMATLFVLASGGGGPMSARLPMMVQVTGIGAVLGGLAFWSADHAAAVAFVLGVATYLGTLAAAIDRRAARAGLFLTLWALIALLLGSADAEPWRASVGFVAGGLIAIAVTAVRLRTIGGDTVQIEDENGEGSDSTSHLDRITAAVSSPIGRFALARTVAVVAAVFLGYWWFSSHSMWVAITVIVILQPSAHQSVSVGVQRTIGTGVGVAVAVLVAEALPRGDTAVVVALLVSGLLMVAFMNANYVLFAAFLTAMLVFGQRLAEVDAFQAGWERLLATAVGAAIAFAVILVVRFRTAGLGESPVKE